jgi:pimeloyl-ACP methyl ester carboxylesterase
LAAVVDGFTVAIGGPVGFRLAMAHPERVQALVIQNAVAHEEGLGPLWETRRAYWRDRGAYEEKLRANLTSLEATKQRHLGTPARIRNAMIRTAGPTNTHSFRVEVRRQFKAICSMIAGPT